AAEGPNDAGNTTTKYTSTGDSDLQTLAGYDTNDRAVLTFNFVPTGDVVEFRYLFASEEYPEWACSQYNDVFGFFISGPGISGPYSNSAVNIALLPDNSPVAINDIHVGGWNQADGESSNNPATCPDINAAYYVAVPAGATTIEYDGRTTVLTARVENLEPCSTYTIKIAIADTSDQKWDSAVFLEAESFASITADITNYTLDTETDDVFQGCGPNEIRFGRGESGDITQEVSISYTVGGTAVAGVHHDLPVSGTAVLPAYQEYVAVPYTLPLVSIDSTKTIVVSTVIGCPCDNPPITLNKTIRIHDPFVLASLTAQDVSSCTVDDGSITVLADAGASSFDYVFTYELYDGVVLLSSLTGGDVAAVFNNLGSGTYRVRITAALSCHVLEDFITVDSPDAPAPPAVSSNSPLCDGETLQLYAGSEVPGATFLWLGPNDFTSTDQNPTLPDASLVNGGTYFVTLTAPNSCTASGNTTVVVNALPQVTCPENMAVFDNEDPLTLSGAAPSGGTYSGTGVTGGNFDPSAAGLGVHEITYTYTDGNGCSNTCSFTITVNGSSVLECPEEGLVYGQAIGNPGDNPSLAYYLSDDALWTGAVTIPVENFNAEGRICDVHWWGVEVDGDGQDCELGENTFAILVAGNIAAGVVEYQVVPEKQTVAEGVPVWNEALGQTVPLTIYRYDVEDLGSCVNLCPGGGTSFINIRSTHDPAMTPTCYFGWISTPAGDGLLYEVLVGDMPQEMEGVSDNLAFCLTQKPCATDDDCDDCNLCTTDSCDPVAGCTFTPINCDDSNVCNGLET
ncbi:MAG TPA: choice-of-anchor L domain-containing protein, partial [Candidatus Hydrogenedentes bacterium]|nr:choice-of-anchor L domain-containing protein [Candidatus Hydrogenedentota bacterium]